MNLASHFQVVAGSVAGRDHRHSLKNSHDAYYWDTLHNIIVAVVCDGCGSGDHSEVGAKLSARIVTRQVFRWYNQAPEFFRTDRINQGLSVVRRSTLGQIQVLADEMAGSFTDVISHYFLSTILGAIITPDEIFIFGAGDGIFAVNGDMKTIESPGNKPDYLAYALVETETKTTGLFKVHAISKTDKVESILLGTDGLGDHQRAAEKKMPGKDEKVGSVEQYWTEDRYFSNPFAIQRRLNLINREITKPDYDKRVNHEEHGHLLDDTTMVVIRRRE